MAILIKPDNTMQVLRPANQRYFTLKELQKLVDGFIEVTYPASYSYRGKLLVINEEGKLNDLPLNEIATIIYDRYPDWIAGNALLCRRSEVK